MSPDKLGEFTEEFLLFENKLNLFDKKVENIFYWEMMRKNIYTDIQKNLFNLSNPDHSGDENQNIGEYMKKIWLTIKNTIYKNPMFADQADVLFIANSKREKTVNQNWEHTIIDPVIDCTEYKSLFLELPFRLTHPTPSKTKNIKYLDYYMYSDGIKKRMTSPPRINEKKRKKCKQLRIKSKKGSKLQ